MNETAQSLREKIDSHSALVGIIGLGYVGLPLALAFAEKGFEVLGFDVDPDKVAKLKRGECYIKHIDRGRVAAAVESERFWATTDFDRLDEPDVILICVPTPLGAHREPDMRYVEGSAWQIRARIRPGQLVVLESTTYPGTTDEMLLPILSGAQPDRRHTSHSEGTAAEALSAQSRADAGGEGRGQRSTFNVQHSTVPDHQLTCGEEFFLAFSPEREDPGNPRYGTTNTPKVVGGVDQVSGDLAEALYAQIMERTVRVASSRVAEASKLMENIFRAVNIALVNELKLVFERMDIDVWEVLDAAETKPFGFMRFNPGPGLGGHCLRGDQWLRVRGRGVSGLYRAEDLYRRIRRDCDVAITRGGMYLETPGLEALSLDVASGEVGWHPVRCLYRGAYDGEGVAIDTDDGASLVVTSLHPMLVREGPSFRARKATEVVPGSELPRAIEAVGPDDQCSLETARVLKIAPIDLSGVVYSLEVEGAESFVTNTGIVVHNCIPLDPFYLAWKAREHGMSPKFIELAGEVNTHMPEHVVEKLGCALNEQGKAMKGSKVLVLGLAYKPDIDDPRESPSFEIIELLLGRGAEVSYHDPHIPVAPAMRSWPDLPEMRSVELTAETLANLDAAVIVTDHKAVDYDLVVEHAPLVLDTRGVLRHRDVGTIYRA